MSLIECKNINRYFGEGENRVHILKNINLTIQKGDFVAIIGQSGSGKSTLMNILGLLDTPTSGTYSIAGTETSKMSVDELAAMRRKRFGFIFQRYNLLSSISCRTQCPCRFIVGQIGVERQRKKQTQRVIRGSATTCFHRPSVNERRRNHFRGRTHWRTGFRQRRNRDANYSRALRRRTHHYHGYARPQNRRTSQSRY